MKRKALSLLTLSLCLSWGFSMTAMAQDPAKIWLRNGPYRLLDTPEIMDEVDYARELAGDDYYFLTTQRLQCNDIDETYTVQQSPGSNHDKGGKGWHEVPAVPTQVFDNVYYVGGYEVGGWLIDTGDGYIMLDSSYDYGFEEVLLPNMTELGLDPANVKYIMITHGSGPGGGDHAGAVSSFKEVNPDLKIVISQVEWDRTLSKLESLGLDKDSWIAEENVVIGSDGKTLTVGDTTVTMVHTPRNVEGGGLSYFIPVKINGKRHLWATYGNTNVTGDIADKEVYLQSMEKWLGYVDDLKPDIAISSHPFVDASIDRMDIIRECNDRPGHHKEWKNRRECRQNPFVIGKQGARRYFEILEQCAVVVKMREEYGIDKTGVECMKGLELDPATGECIEP